jgi:hypothetical protein
MRKLSENFLNDLKSTNGLLHPILEHVRQDDTLMLAMRNQYINIYYRGGNLLKVKEQGNGSYGTFFDRQYNKSGKTIPDLPATIKSQNDARTRVAAFPYLKEIMDLHFSNNSKPEREYQQLVARENNCSTISNQSEYFISDIEFADSGLGVRFDMLAIRWLASQRKHGSKCRVALIEMKYGDGALDGSSGLLKHLQDIDALISNNEKYESLLKTMEWQFNQLDELGMLNFKQCRNGTRVKLVANDKPEVIFVLANHNPRSTKLTSILDKPEVVAYGQTQRFDLRFLVSCFAGYGLHSDCMLTLPQFRKKLKSSSAKQSAALDGDSAALHPRQ